MITKDEAKARALARVGRHLEELQARHGGKFYWRNGVVRHITGRTTKGPRDVRFGTLRAPLIDGCTVLAHEVRK